MKKSNISIFIILTAILVVSGFFVFISKVQAETLYVCPKMSEECTYDSIQDAITDAVAGDRIEVAAGTYNERIIIDKPLTLRGATYEINKNGYDVPEDYAWDDSVESIINNPDPSGDYSAIVDIIDTDNVTFEGFVVQEFNAVSNNVDSLLRVYAHTKEISNIVIRNNVIGPFTNTISQDGTHGRMGLYIANHPYSDEYGVVDSTFSGNKIFDCKGNGNNVFIWSSYFSYGAPGPASMTGTIIENNEIYGSHRSGIETAGGFSGLIIRNNTIYGNSGLETDDPTDLKYGHGILIDRGSSDRTVNGLSAVDLTIKNNEIYNNEKSAIYFGPINENYTIEDNIISGNGWDGIMIDFDGNFCNPDFEACPLPDEVKSCYDCTENININKNGFIDNENYGIHVVSSEATDIIINAKNNYWGSVTGPNTEGADNIEGDVDFAPFYTDVAMTIESTEYSVCATGCNFTTIQDALDVAESGNIINIDAGTYVQDDDLTIDKTITLLGISDEKPTIQFDGKCDSIVIEADNVSLENIIFYKTNQEEGWSSPPICAANTILEIPKAGPPEYLSIYEGLNIDGCSFEGGRMAMYINSKGDFTLTNSEFTDFAGNNIVHIAAFDGDLTISGNIFSDISGRAVVFESGPDEQILYGGTINISENNFTDGKSLLVYNHWVDNSKKVDINIEDNNLSDVSEEAILFLTCRDVDLSKISSVEMLGNTISDAKYGIRIDTTYYCPDLGIPTNVTGTFDFNAHSNSFSDIDEYGVLNETSSLINAEQNYWGDSTGPEHAVTNISGLGDEVSDNVSYSPWYTDSELTSLKTPTTPDGTGNNVSTITQPTNIVANNITVSMPAGITITATASWQGIINAPSVGIAPSATPSKQANENLNIDSVIELGYPDTKLTFNKAVKIVLPDKAGKRVGYTRTDEPFIEITNVCSDDIQPTDDSFLPPEGDCKTDAGNDLVIWTKHFTQFVVYDFSLIPPVSHGFRAPPEPEEEPSVLSEEAQRLDTNKDDEINDLDLRELFANWGNTILDNIADFNDDSNVDIFDFNLLMIHWTE